MLPRNNGFLTIIINDILQFPQAVTGGHLADCRHINLILKLSYSDSLTVTMAEENQEGQSLWQWELMKRENITKIILLTIQNIYSIFKLF